MIIKLNDCFIPLFKETKSTDNDDDAAATAVNSAIELLQNAVQQVESVKFECKTVKEDLISYLQLHKATFQLGSRGTAAGITH